jgi:glutamate/tyrosine decarboxylase-like PLP-dependent enzyme
VTLNRTVPEARGAVESRPEEHLTVNPTLYRPVLERASAHALDHLEHLDDAPVAATASLSELRARLARPLPDGGTDAGQVIDDLVADCAGGIIGSAGGRFFGWVMGGAVPASLAADWLTSAWDQNAASFGAAPAEAVVEEVCGAWLKDLLGLPETASFALATGSQMAHATCLAAARNALFARCGWDVERKGLTGGPPLRVLTSDQRHGSIERAVRLLGFGTDCLIDLPADEQGALRGETLGEALRGASGQPTIVLLQAGDLNVGAFDPFDVLIPLAHEHGAWVHVDGAFGLRTAASSIYRKHVAGAERADSWVVDGHKWLNVPYDCGYAFVADPRPHRAAMSSHADYVSHSADARDERDWNPDWSRRGRGFATYAALRELGRQGVADLVERTCRHAHTLATRIGGLPGAVLVSEPRINQGLVRFLSPAPGAIDADHDRRTDEIIAAILRTGEAFFSGTTWRGKRCMRISVCNWQTTDADVERVVAAVRRTLAASR